MENQIHCLWSCFKILTIVKILKRWQFSLIDRWLYERQGLVFLSRIFPKSSQFFHWLILQTLQQSNLFRRKWNSSSDSLSLIQSLILMLICSFYKHFQHGSCIYRLVCIYTTLNTRINECAVCCDTLFA